MLKREQNERNNNKKKKNREGGRGWEDSNSCLHLLLHKSLTSKQAKKKQRHKQTTPYSKQAVRQGKLRKITKCLLAGFHISG